VIVKAVHIGSGSGSGIHRFLFLGCMHVFLYIDFWMWMGGGTGVWAGKMVIHECFYLEKKVLESDDVRR